VVVDQGPPVLYLLATLGVCWIRYEDRRMMMIMKTKTKTEMRTKMKTKVRMKIKTKLNTKMKRYI
jgi:hypothetical protein